MSVTEVTLRWVDEFVIKYALCPFAALPFRAGRVGATEIETADEEEAFYAALTQVQSLLDAESQTLETSLLVFSSDLLTDFDTFLDFVYTFEDALAEAGADELVQLAHFHPDYRFDGVDEDDPGNRTNRSPYPIIQLLRTDSVATAVASYPDTELIPERNVARMRAEFGKNRRFSELNTAVESHGFNMTLQARLSTLHQLAVHLTGPEDEFLTALQKRTEFNNAWFTLANQQASVKAIAEEFLAEEKLSAWLSGYKIIPIAGDGFVPQPGPNGEGQKTVGLVLAGNIPLVGFHDILCVYVAGHKARIKLSSKDEYVLPYLLKLLAKFDEKAEDYFDLVDKFEDYDAVIATGSNNSARYFETYFAKVPHIIRKNRNAVAVLSGKESEDEMRALGNDVFQYFGLGCRNVSKLYVPEGYDFDPLLHVFHEWKGLQNHTKWKNNFDYNYALTTLNKESFHLTGPLMVLENKPIPSRIGTLHFEYYSDKSVLETNLGNQREEIQLIVSSPDYLNTDLPVFTFGQAQQPALSDYADGVDTLAFLLSL